MKVVVENCLIHDAEKEVGREDRMKELSSNGAVAMLRSAMMMMMMMDDSRRKVVDSRSQSLQQKGRLFAPPSRLRCWSKNVELSRN
jgi:hypothetical protein